MRAASRSLCRLLGPGGPDSIPDLELAVRNDATRDGGAAASYQHGAKRKLEGASFQAEVRLCHLPDAICDHGPVLRSTYPRTKK